jgi:hypothetical protein
MKREVRGVTDEQRCNDSREEGRSEGCRGCKAVEKASEKRAVRRRMDSREAGGDEIVRLVVKECGGRWGDR